jgi:hypothetical protein
MNIAGHPVAKYGQYTSYYYNFCNNNIIKSLLCLLRDYCHCDAFLQNAGNKTTQ